MAATCPTTCPTTAGVRSAGFSFEPTFGGACPAGYSSYPYGFDFPASKTYASIFNREAGVPCPTSSPMPVNFPVDARIAPFAGAYSTPYGYPSAANWPVTGVPSTWFNTPFERVNTPYGYPMNTTTTPFTGYNNLPSTWYPGMPTGLNTPTPFEYTAPWYNAERMAAERMAAERMAAVSPFAARNNWFNNTNAWTSPAALLSTGLSTPLSSNNWWNNTINTLCNVAFRPSNPIEFYCLTNPIRVLDREGNRCLWLCFDLRGYKAEEVTVTLNKTERCVIVEAAHEVKEGKEHHVMRKFSRKFVLPETLAKIDLAKCELKSCLTADGMLTIECPLPKMTTEEIARCPVMSRNFNAAPFGVAPYNNYYGCPSTCNVAPIATKIC